MCWELYLAPLEKNSSPDGGHLKCESENFGPSKFRGEEIWLHLELVKSFWLIFFCIWSFKMMCKIIFIC
jgi:hypothetical protein